MTISLKSGVVIVSTFFVTIATILGSGILSLPTALFKSGFKPFLVSFFPGLIAQLLLVLLMIELLQRTQYDLHKQLQTGDQYQPLSQQTSSDDELYTDNVSPEQDNDTQDDAQDDAQDESDSDTDNVDSSDKSLNQSPNLLKIMKYHPKVDTDLHSMGKLYLSPIFRFLFDLAVMVHFFSVLIGYSLAGPRAISEIFRIHKHFQWLIFPFVFILSVTIIIGWKVIQQLITVMTFIKGTLLLVILIIVGIMSREVNEQSTDHFQFISRPFLIGTVAIGGAINTLPMLYSQLKPTKFNIVAFGTSAMSAIVVCWILNLIWCYLVLHIVPQDGKNSLKEAYENGEISTVPVSEIIQQDFPKFKYLVNIVNWFISISISVSFLTMGAALKHVLDGIITEIMDRNHSDTRFDFTRRTFFQFFSKLGLYIFCFTLIWFVAQLSLKDFQIIIESFTSFALNIESGLFIVFMLFKARQSKGKIPLPIPKIAFVGAGLFVSIYFMFSCAFDIVYSILRHSIKHLPI